MDSKIANPLSLAATSLALILNVGGVNASIVDNARSTSGGNGTAATAQDVESNFTTGGGNANITNSNNSNWEWVSITTNDQGYTDSNLDGSSFDFFTFEVFAGQQFIFDIDTDAVSPDPDSILRLYDGARLDDTQISFNDDMSGTPTFEFTLDDGSQDVVDSLLYHTFASDGSATLRVSECNFSFSTRECDEGVLSKNATYALQISRSLSPVPVPAAVWLFGTALIGFVGMSRRTTVKA